LTVRPEVRLERLETPGPLVIHVEELPAEVLLFSESLALQPSVGLDFPFGAYSTEHLLIGRSGNPLL